MAEVMGQTRFSDIVLDDASLSMAAKGVFVTVGFVGNGCTYESLAEHATETIDAIRKVVGELIEAGYLTIEEEEKLYIKTAPSFGVLG